MPSRFVNQSSRTQRTEQILLGFVDFGLMVALFVVPMILGGNHATGRLMLVLSAAIAGTAWAAHQAIRHQRFFPSTWAIAILAIGLLIPLVQLVPLPEEVRHFLSPYLTKILPLWQADTDPATRLGNWQCLSLTPSATRASLVIFGAYSLLFVVVAGRVQTVKDLQRVLRWCGGAVLMVAVFAMVQHFLGNGKFFWFYKCPYRTTGIQLSGPFPNRNHFAQFMALGIGPLLVWIVSHYSSSSSRSAKKHKLASSHSRSPVSASPLGPDPFVKASHKAKHRKGWRARLVQMTFSSGNSLFDSGSQTEGPTLTTSMKAGQFLLAMIAGFVAFACLLSLSRGGSLAMMLAIVVCCGISFTVKGASRRMFGAVTMAGIVLGAALMIFGYKNVCDRLGNLTSGKVELMDMEVGRRAIWETDLRASTHFPILGTGVGSHCEVYPIFFDYAHYDYREFTHAENGYIQTLLETGTVGTLLLFSAIGMVGFWCFMGIKKSRSDQLRLCLAAISASISASLFHSMTDFIWYIPGCATMTVILVACAFSAFRLAIQEAGEPATEPSKVKNTSTRARSISKKPVDPSIAWTMVGAMVFISLVMIQERIGPARAQPYWDDYLRAEEASNYDTIVLDNLSSEELRDAARFYVAQIERLQKVVKFQPDHARAHHSLALNCLKLFDAYQVVGTNPMSLMHISDAALKAGFGSQKELITWLERAFGKRQITLLRMARHHALCSVRACPTMGRSYLYLTELCFLERFSFDQKMQLIDQSLLVRPQCGQSVLALAKEVGLSGNFEQWSKLSKRVYDTNIDIRNEVLRGLIDNSLDDMLPVVIGLIIQQFEPDQDAALFMIERCKRRISEPYLDSLRRYCATKAITDIEKCTPAEQAHRRCIAALQYRELGDLQASLTQLRMAHRCDPNNIEVRQNLAQCLIDAGSPKEAQEHLKWCLHRRPGNKYLEKLYHASLAADLDAQARAGENTEVTR